MRTAATLLASALLALASPTTTGSAVEAAPAGLAPVALVVDDAAVCREASEKLTLALRQFTVDMRRVSALATGGDLTGAEAMVKEGGATLRRAGEELAATAERAGTPDLAEAVAEVAAEFRRLGEHLVSLASLRTLEPDTLEETVKALGRVCGADVPPPASEPASTGGVEPAPTRAQQLTPTLVPPTRTAAPR